jgi:hypothetical protein
LSKTIRKVEDKSDNNITRTPMAKETRNILKVKPTIVGLVIPYLVATSGKPGAIIELLSGETNV